MALDLVFGADNLHYPLTGIGRYAFELASRLEQDERIACVRYFSLGRWLASPLAALSKVESAPANAAATVGLQTRLAAQPWAVQMYNMLSPAWFQWRLRGLARPQIFHSPNFLAPPCKAIKVTTVHDLSHVLFPQFHPAARTQLMARAFPRSLARTDHVITVSETVRQELLERYRHLSADRVSSIHLAADAVFRPHTPQILAPTMQTLGLRAGQYCLFVGTVEPRKNVERLIQAYAMLPADMRREWPLVVAGGKGWNSEAIHARMAKAQAEGWLRYVSFVDQRWLPALYAGARLMAYPSLYEGFGLPIVEAMASGTPVLTSNTSCMPEVAGGAARLVDPLDVDGMAHALAECLSNEQWRTDAQTKGLARAAGLSWDRCAEETVAVYRRLA